MSLRVTRALAYACFLLALLSMGVFLCIRHPFIRHPFLAYGEITGRGWILWEDLWKDLGYMVQHPYHLMELSYLSMTLSLVCIPLVAIASVVLGRIWWKSRLLWILWTIFCALVLACMLVFLRDDLPHLLETEYLTLHLFTAVPFLDLAGMLLLWPSTSPWNRGRILETPSTTLPESSPP